MNHQRLQEDDMQPDENLILELVAEATISRLDLTKDSFLFHSAGKDSNSIALALAEAGWQDKVTLITHKSKGAADESELSGKIAKKLGFRHAILNEVDHFKVEHFDAIEEYFRNAPFPGVDNVTLAYPLYSNEMPELRGANLIDGGGNDSYMITPPSNRELRILSLAKVSSKFSFLRKYSNSENIISSLLKTPAEWFGMSGLSLKDADHIYASNRSVFKHWRDESSIRKDWDTYDFKTDILTTVVAAEQHIRKARNFSDAINARLVLPFSNRKVVGYFARMPERYLFDRNEGKNKLILRKILKDRIGLDSDLLGKKGWTYDHTGVVARHLPYMFNTIFECSLWSADGVESLKRRLLNTPSADVRKTAILRGAVYRVFLISMFWKLNKYLR